MPVTDGIFIPLCRSTPEGTAEKVQGESKSSVYRPSLSQKLEKGKPPERMGRKARGLRLAKAMTARPPMFRFYLSII